MGTDYYITISREEREYFSLPKGWVPLHFAEPTGDGTGLSVEGIAREALERPSKTPPLSALVKDAGSVAVIIDDATRPTPVAAVLSVLLPYLADAGIPRENISIVVALGTHSPVPSTELEERVGSDVAANYRIVQHNAWQDDLVPIQVPGEGALVKINPVVAGAKVKIGISSILPHPMAGYGGGPKIIMPGVANFEYIRDHHMRYTIDPGSVAGRTGNNPFHEGCMNVARAVGLDFSINCVYNQHGEIVSILGGSLDAAFAAAVEICFEKLGVRFDEKVDVTITSTYPHTHAHQFAKGVSAPDVVTKETGAILLVVPTVSPVPEEFLKSFDLVRERSHNQPVAYVKEAMSKGLPFLPEKALEFNMAMKCLIVRPLIRTILVSRMISEEQARTMGFEYAGSIAEGLKLLESTHPDARVAIFPSGGLIVPITAW
jgi:lactate racemase